MKSVDTVETRTQQQPDETADASASSSVVLAMVNKEADTSARKKRQPRPRPAQCVAEIHPFSATLLTKDEVPEGIRTSPKCSLKAQHAVLVGYWLRLLKRIKNHLKIWMNCELMMPKIRILRTDPTASVSAFSSTRLLDKVPLTLPVAI